MLLNFSERAIELALVTTAHLLNVMWQTPLYMVYQNFDMGKRCQMLKKFQTIGKQTLLK
jgi:hypothetical protein